RLLGIGGGRQRSCDSGEELVAEVSQLGLLGERGSGDLAGQLLKSLIGIRRERTLYPLLNGPVVGGDGLSEGFVRLRLDAHDRASADSVRVHEEIMVPLASRPFVKRG